MVLNKLASDKPITLLFLFKNTLKPLNLSQIVVNICTRNCNSAPFLAFKQVSWIAHAFLLSLLSCTTQDALSQSAHAQPEPHLSNRNVNCSETRILHNYECSHKTPEMECSLPSLRPVFTCESWPGQIYANILKSWIFSQRKVPSAQAGNYF